MIERYYQSAGGSELEYQLLSKLCNLYFLSVIILIYILHRADISFHLITRSFFQSHSAQLSCEIRIFPVIQQL